MAAQIIIIGLAFCFGVVSGGYLVYFAYLKAKRITQQPNEPLEKYMGRVGRPISETFPQYLERVGAIKPKFELSEELKAKYGSFGDIPRPTRHMGEKEILDKFDIDIAKTCEEALHNIKANREVLLNLHNKAIEEKAKRYFEEKDPEEEYGSFEEFLKREREKNKRRFEPFSDRIFPLDKNGNGGC